MKSLVLAFLIAAAPALALADAPAEPVAADRYLERDEAPPHRGCGPQPDGERPTADGRTHGDLAAQVGTDGSRAAAARFCAPLGENGQVTVAVSRSEGARWRPHHQGGHPEVPNDR
jgi:hypothetical protein